MKKPVDVLVRKRGFTMLAALVFSAALGAQNPPPVTAPPTTAPPATAPAAGSAAEVAAAAAAVSS